MEARASHREAATHFDPNPRNPRDAVRVYVVAEGDAMRAGLAALVEDEPGIVLAGAGPAPRDDVEADVYLAETGDGLDGAMGALPMVMLGAARGPAGVVGRNPRAWLSHDAPAAQIAAAIRAVAAGLSAWPAAAPREFAPGLPGRVAPGGQEGERLTAREREVLDLVALGLPNKGIALRLGVSEHTAKFHVGAVLAKLGAASRAEAVAIAVRNGTLTL